MWSYTFDEYGGYDCMSSAFSILDGDQFIATVDVADFEGEGPNAHRRSEEAENYVKAINELGLIYFFKDLNKSQEYYKKAIALRNKSFRGKWPGKLEWGIWENRPILQAIQGLALIHWREYEIEEAKKLFVFLLKLNPNDNQGIRYCLSAIYKGLTWEDFGKIEDKCADKGNYQELDNLLIEQNEAYKFWKNPGENKDEQR